MKEPEKRLLTSADICIRYNMSRSTLYRKIRSGHFPRPMRAYIGHPRWLLDSLEDWETEMNQKR